MFTKISNATVIIRTVGERTSELCAQIARDQVAEENVFIINEIPFSSAVKRTFIIGLENQLPWTIALDADTLVKKNGFRELIHKAEQYPRPFFKGNGRGIVKFFGGGKLSNPHIYTTKFIHTALELFPEENHLRPETNIKDIVNQKLGLEQAYFTDVVAIQDFEQYYSDIFRKSIVFGHKHQEKLQIFFKNWGNNLSTDLDYLVAFAGLFAGLYSDKSIEIDANKIPANFQALPFLAHLDEKTQLQMETPYVFIEKIIRSYNLKTMARKIKAKFSNPFL